MIEADGNSVIDQSTGPPFNDRRPGEPDATWGDRPGIVASLLRYRVIVVSATLLGAVAGYALAQLLPVRYQASATFILSDPGGPTILGGGNSLGTSDRQVYLAKQADIMSSRVVIERALQILGSDQSVPDVRDELKVQPAANMASISVVATTADPRSAAALANAVGTAYEQVTQERVAADSQRAIASLEELQKHSQADFDALPRSPDGELTSRQQQLAAQIADLQQREQDITTQVGVYASGVEYFEQAEPPTAPSQPRPKLDTALGGLLGMLVAAAWAWRAAGRHLRTEGRAQPARILEAPLLGEVPPPRAPQMTTGEAVPPTGLDPVVDDAFYFIVASMEHELAGVGGKSIAVTSVGPGDSKTSTALQIASAASQQNRHVLLIEADVPLRHLSERVSTAQAAGKRTSQKRPTSVEAKRYIERLVSTDSGMVLPLATTAVDARHPEGSDGAVDVREAVRYIGDGFDLVLIDAPALLASWNALGVAQQADGVVLVVPHRVSLGDLREARDRLAFVKTPLLGYVYVRPRGRRFSWKPGSRRDERS